MDKTPPANAGNMSLIPGPGRFHMPWSNEAHVPQLLSSALELESHSHWAHAPHPLKLTRREPMLRNERSHAVKRPRKKTKHSPCSLQLETAWAKQRRLGAVEINKNYIKIILLLFNNWMNYKSCVEMSVVNSCQYNYFILIHHYVFPNFPPYQVLFITPQSQFQNPKPTKLVWQQIWIPLNLPEGFREPRWHEYSYISSKKYSCVTSYSV